MLLAKISGGLMRRLYLTYHLKEITTEDHKDAGELQDGDVYIRIHLGWKSLMVFGLVVAQTAVNLLSSQYNLF